MTLHVKCTCHYRIPHVHNLPYFDSELHCNELEPSVFVCHITSAAILTWIHSPAADWPRPLRFRLQRVARRTASCSKSFYLCQPAELCERALHLPSPSSGAWKHCSLYRWRWAADHWRTHGVPAGHGVLPSCKYWSSSLILKCDSVALSGVAFHILPSSVLYSPFSCFYCLSQLFLPKSRVESNVLPLSGQIFVSVIQMDFQHAAWEGRLGCQSCLSLSFSLSNLILSFFAHLFCISLLLEGDKCVYAFWDAVRHFCR